MTVSPPITVFSFTDFSAATPLLQQPGDRIDAQFLEYKRVYTDLVAALALIQRTDGLLKNGSVRAETLAPDLLAGIVADAEAQIAPAVASAVAASGAATTAKDATVAVAATVAGQAATVAMTHDVIMGAAGSALANAQAAAAEITAKTALIQTLATNADNAENDALLAAATAEEWAQVSVAWAEYMPGPIPPNILAIMGVTGDHWSSKWWSNRANQDAGSAAADADRAEAAAGEAEADADRADAAANAAEALYDELDDRYLGAKATPPTLDNDGNPLQEGALYFDTVLDQMLVWNGTAWQAFAGATIASDVAFSPTDTITATNAQLAIVEALTDARAYTDAAVAPLTPDAPVDGKTYARKDDAWIESITKASFDSTVAGIEADLTALDNTTISLDGRMDAVEVKNTAQDAAIALRITDAPNNSSAYVRKGAAWVLDPLQSDAPNDGQQYARKNQAWAAFVSPIPTDAPSDGKTYGRLNAGWTQIVGGATISDTAPPAPLAGQLWWESDTGALNVWYQDANSNQWVQTNAAGIPDAPVDGKVYARKNNGWIESADKATVDGKASEAPSDNIQYMRQNGVWVPAGLSLVNSGTVSSSTQYVPMLLPASYRSFILRFRRCRATPASTGYLQLQFSSDGGATYWAGAGNYDWVNKYFSSTGDGLGAEGKWSAGGSNTASAITLSSGQSDATTIGGCEGEVSINRGVTGAELPVCHWHTSLKIPSGFSATTGSGFFGGLTTMNACRLCLSLGNAFFGTIEWELYGYRG